MVKLLPLLSAALPSLSVKTDDPQVLLQMANARRHGSMSTEHLHNGVHAMETRVEAIVSEAVASGQYPSKLTDAAYNTMLAALTDIETQLEQEKTANEDAWSDANAEVMACATTMKTMLETDPKGANPLKQAYEGAQGDHADCRDGPNSDGEPGEDTVNGKEKEAHTHMTNTAKNAKTAKPECLKSDEEGETSLAKAQRVLAALELAAEWAENHEANVRTANSDYADKRDAAIQKAKECDDDQSEFEKAFCEYAVSVKTICSERDSCVATNKELRDQKKTQLKNKVDAEKLILQSCSKVRCYLKLIKGERNAAGNLTSDAYTITQTEYNKCKSDGTYDAVSGTWNATGPDKLNICVTGDADGTCEDEPDTCDLSVIATTPDNSDGKSGAWYDKYYKDLEPDETWMDERVGLEDIVKCHRHPEKPAPLPEPTAAEWCSQQCEAQNFICNDPTIGSHRLVSCAQACLMRSQGSTYEDLMTKNTGVCWQRKCDLEVNGHSFNLCKVCKEQKEDNSWNKKRNDFAAGRPECDFGAKLNPPGSVPSNPTTPPPEAVKTVDKTPSKECEGTGLLIPQGTGNEDEWRCKAGYCIPAANRCNGHANCGDKSDEEGC